MEQTKSTSEAERNETVQTLAKIAEQMNRINSKIDVLREKGESNPPTEFNVFSADEFVSLETPRESRDDLNEVVVELREKEAISTQVDEPMPSPRPAFPIGSASRLKPKDIIIQKVPY